MWAGRGGEAGPGGQTVRQGRATGRWQSAKGVWGPWPHACREPVERRRERELASGRAQADSEAVEGLGWERTRVKGWAGRRLERESASNGCDGPAAAPSRFPRDPSGSTRTHNSPALALLNPCLIRSPALYQPAPTHIRLRPTHHRADADRSPCLGRCVSRRARCSPARPRRPLSHVSRPSCRRSKEKNDAQFFDAADAHPPTLILRALGPSGLRRSQSRTLHLVLVRYRVRLRPLPTPVTLPTPPAPRSLQ